MTNGFYLIENARLTSQIQTLRNHVATFKPRFEYWIRMSQLLTKWNARPQYVASAIEQRDTVRNELIDCFGTLAAAHQDSQNNIDCTIKNTTFCRNELQIAHAHSLAMRPAPLRPALRVLYWIQSTFNHR